jgi:hypothetical protein
MSEVKSQRSDLQERKRRKAEALKSGAPRGRRYRLFGYQLMERGKNELRKRSYFLAIH